MTDTHCHLNDPEAFPNPAAAAAEAMEAGVSRLVVVGVDSESSRLAVEIASQAEGVFAAVGWHPTSSDRYKPSDLRTIRDLASHPKCVAIGEIGYDFYWDNASREQQDACLADHLDLAADLGKPIVFHCRNAYPALLDALESRGAGPYLLHCFAGDKNDADRAIALGCLFGVDGPVTYKKADDLRATLRHIGLDKLVLETDSPWLAPVPFRGKPNHPKHLGHICQGVADALGCPASEVERVTDANAARFFGF